MSVALRSHLRSGVEGLTPGYFALVMASGILSVGMALRGHRTLSMLLLAVCATAFVVLALLNLWRAVAVELWVAFGAGALGFAAMLGHLGRELVRTPHP